jgi:transcriptional regulator with XRE-family HTH domain
LSTKLKDGLIVGRHGLSEVAKQLRLTAGETQEVAAERIGKSQEQVSRAEAGDKSHVSICVLMIEEYSDFRVEHPLYRFKKDTNVDE